MKCNDVQDILFAYIDGDVSDEERRAVSEHLSHCQGCTHALEEFRKNGNILRELGATPPFPEYTEATIRQKASRKSGLNRLPRPVAIALPVILIMAIILPITLAGGATNVLAKAYAAIEKLESYRATAQMYTYFPDTDETVLSAADEAAFGGNDTYMLKTYPSGTGYYRQIIAIGDDYYWYGRQLLRTTGPEMYFDEIMPSKDKTLDYLALIENIETLDDEIINGTECYHYKGTVSTEKWLAVTLPKSRERYEKMWFDIDIEAALVNLERYWRTREIRYELWVGKDDYLIRQVKDTTGLISNSFYKTILVQNYSNFNEPIEIIPPLDENGELLEGWTKQSFAE